MFEPCLPVADLEMGWNAFLSSRLDYSCLCSAILPALSILLLELVQNPEHGSKN